jgi:Ran GTPase-activating protein (RanGAP) involved in mRNA processing and transport
MQDVPGREDAFAAMEAMPGLLRHESGLLTLDLSYTGLSDAAGKKLAEMLANHRTLKTLTLVGNAVAAQTTKALGAALTVNGTLAYLDLRDNSIDDWSLQKVDKDGAALLAHSLNGNSALKELRLSGNTIGRRSGLTLAEALASEVTALTLLDLSSCHFSDECGAKIARALAKNFVLAVLDLSGNGSIGQSSGAAMAELLAFNQHLKRLDLSHCMMGEAEGTALAAALQTNESLHELILSGTGIGNRTGQEMVSTLVHHNEVLKRFEVSTTAISAKLSHEIRRLLHLEPTLRILQECIVDLLPRLRANDPRLADLNLSDKLLKDVDADALVAALEQNTAVTALDLSKNIITAESTGSLARVLAMNSTLTSLKLDTNKIGDDGARTLSEVAGCSLAMLSLSDCDIGNVGGKAVAGNFLQENRPLMVLDLSNNRLGNGAAIALAAELKTNVTLKELRLGFNEIKDDGGTAFAGVLKSRLQVEPRLQRRTASIGDGERCEVATAAHKQNRTLEVLALNSNRIGDAGGKNMLKMLQLNNTLLDLYLQDNCMSVEVEFKLKRVLECSPSRRVAEAVNAAKAYQQALDDAKSLLVGRARSLFETPPIAFKRNFAMEVGGVLLTDFGVELMVDAGTRITGQLLIKKLSGDQIQALESPPLGSMTAGPIVELLPQDGRRFNQPITLRIPHNGCKADALKVVSCKWISDASKPELKGGTWSELPPSAYRVVGHSIEARVSEGSCFAVVQDEITPERVGCRAFRVAKGPDTLEQSDTLVQIWITPEREDSVQELNEMLEAQGFMQCGESEELLHGIHRSKLTVTLLKDTQSKVWDTKKPHCLFDVRVPASDNSTALIVKLEQSFREAVALYNPEQIAKFVSVESAAWAKYADRLKSMSMSGNTFLQLDDTQLRDVLKVEDTKDRHAMLEVVQTLNATFVTDLPLTLSSARGQEVDDDVNPEENLPPPYAPLLIARSQVHFVLRTRPLRRTRVGFKVDEMLVEFAEVAPEANGLPLDEDYRVIPCTVSGWGQEHLQLECSCRVFTGFVRIRAKDYSGLGPPSKAVPILPCGFGLLDNKKARRFALKAQNINSQSADSELVGRLGRWGMTTARPKTTSHSPKKEASWKARLVLGSSSKSKQAFSDEADSGLVIMGTYFAPDARPASASGALVSRDRPELSAATEGPGGATGAQCYDVTASTTAEGSVNSKAALQQICDVIEEVEAASPHAKTFVANCKCLTGRLAALAASLPFVADGDEPELWRLLECAVAAKGLIDLHFHEGYMQRYLLLDDEQAFEFEAIDDKLLRTISAVPHWGACVIQFKAAGRCYNTMDAEICSFKRRKLIELILRGCSAANSSKAPPVFRNEAIQEVCLAATGFGIHSKDLKVEMAELWAEGGLPHVKHANTEVNNILGQMIDTEDCGFLNALLLNISKRGEAKKTKIRKVGSVALAEDINSLALDEVEGMKVNDGALVRRSDDQWVHGSLAYLSKAGVMKFKLNQMGATKTLTRELFSEVRRLPDRAIVQSNIDSVNQQHASCPKKPLSIPFRAKAPASIPRSDQGPASSSFLLGSTARAEDQQHFVDGLKVNSVALVCRDDGVWYYAKLIRRVQCGLVEERDTAVEVVVGNDGFKYGALLINASDELEFSLMEDGESEPKLKNPGAAKKGVGRDRVGSLPEVMTTANLAQQAGSTSRKGSAPLALTKWALASAVGVGLRCGINALSKKKRTTLVVPPARFCSVRQLGHEAHHHGMVAKGTAARAGSSLDFPGRHGQSQSFFIASFPGKYEDKWLELTKREGNLCTPDDQRVAAACVFFQNESPLYGVHATDSSSGYGRCYCHSLYGTPAGEPFAPGSRAWKDGKAEWGCFWMQCWIKNVERAHALGQLAVVVYFAGMRGDNTKGLGHSQKAEVAWLEKHGIPYFSWDLTDFVHSASRVASAYDRPRNRAPKLRDIDDTLDSTRSWASRRGQLDPSKAVSIIARHLAKDDDSDGGAANHHQNQQQGLKQLELLQNSAADLVDMLSLGDDVDGDEMATRSS